MKMQLTPINELGGWLFKREDLFQPFPFCKANGSKLRQSIILTEKNIETARNGLITGTSIVSPQGVICAATARYLKVPCKIIYGGTTIERIKNEKYPVEAARLGAQIIIGSKCPRTAVLNSIAKEEAKKTNAFVIKYGFDLRNNLDCFIESVAEQVKNIPDELENLVIVVGSSITLIGVLYGIAIYGKSVKNVWGVGCAPNRTDKIKKYAQIIYEEKKVSLPLNILRYVDCFSKYKGFKYENTYDERYMGINFHPRYEAKAFLWMTKALNPKRDRKTLFWINGKDIIE